MAEPCNRHVDSIETFVHVRIGSLEASRWMLVYRQTCSPVALMIQINPFMTLLVSEMRSGEMSCVCEASCMLS